MQQNLRHSLKTSHLSHLPTPLPKCCFEDAQPALAQESIQKLLRTSVFQISLMGKIVLCFKKYEITATQKASHMITLPAKHAGTYVTENLCT